jgi:hypothetical protein
LPTLQSSSQNESMSLKAVGMPNSRSSSLQPVSTNDPILKDRSTPTPTENGSFLSRLFTRRNRIRSVLPTYAKSPKSLPIITEKSLVDTCSSIGVYSEAWASDSPTELRPGEGDGSQNIQVTRQVHQKHQGNENEKGRSPSG